MTDASGSAPSSSAPSDPRASRGAERLLARLELPDAANELLSIATFLTAPDGPIQQLAEAGVSSPWHERVLRKAAERVVVLDHFLRGRVAFFVAGRGQGYGVFDEELEVAGAALDTCRAVTAVLEDLLDGDLPSVQQIRRVGDAAARACAALETL